MNKIEKSYFVLGNNLCILLSHTKICNHLFAEYIIICNVYFIAYICAGNYLYTTYYILNIHMIEQYIMI